MSRAMRGLGGVLLAGCLAASAAEAQPDSRSAAGGWGLGLSHGVSALSAGLEGEDGSGNRLTLAPYRPSVWRLAVSRGGDGLRVTLLVGYGTAGLAASGTALDEDGKPADGPLLVERGVYGLWTATAAISRRLIRLRGGPELRPSLGLGIESWSAVGEPARVIAGGQAGLAMEVVLTRRFRASLEGEVGLTPASPFKPEEQPEGFRKRSTWRRTLAGTIAWRF